MDVNETREIDYAADANDPNKKPDRIQARPPSEIDRVDSTRRLRKIKALLAAGLLTVAGGGLIVAANQEGDPTIETIGESLNKIELRMNDGSVHKVKGDKVRIRSNPNVSSQTETEQGRDNLIKSQSIKAINGTDWDGSSDFKLNNSLYIVGEDPTHRMDEAPWFVVEVQKKSGDQEIGYISHSVATSSIIETVTSGETADVKINPDKSLTGITRSGETISEGQIGQVEIIPSQQSDQ